MSEVHLITCASSVSQSVSVSRECSDKQENGRVICGLIRVSIVLTACVTFLPPCGSSMPSQELKLTKASP